MPEADAARSEEAWTDEHIGDFIHVTLNLASSNASNESLAECNVGETRIFPPSVPDWSNLEVLHRNTLPPRASFSIYDSLKDALARDVSKSKTLSLSGTWKFKLSPNPFDSHGELNPPQPDLGYWGEIKVPGMWQLQNYGEGPQYTNVNYPFPVDPGHVPYDSNETGSYFRTFKIPSRFKNHQLRLRFEGVDSAFHAWINGIGVGYSQGSRSPSEFDVTKLVDLDEENTLAVQVYQYCDGSYLEDQDQWWLSGIFRDVNLLAFPIVHIQDFKVETHLDSDYKDATLSVKAITNIAGVTVGLQLFDYENKIIEQQISNSGSFSVSMKDPKKWTAETPYLYHLVLSVGDSFVEQRVGFRNSELKNGVFVVNGKPVIFRGVNRHEHHPDSGRTVPYEFLRNDLLLMKRGNINAIRTSHYINDTRLYDIADELGFWVLDECDLECHGVGEIGGDPASWLSDNPKWEGAYVDRAKQAIMRDKNHPSVIMWSLGNESFYGRNHQAMYDWIKTYDPTRLIHYEADQEAETVDVYSRMYDSVAQIIEFATQSETWEKPLVLCEYAHAMGNGPGAVKEYVEAFYKYPRLMGGFVWEWANHGLRTNNRDGEEYYGYGGDFGDEPNDGHFVMDGLCFSDHTPTPGLIEYAKAIEPVQVVSQAGAKVTVINRYDYITLDHLKCEWTIIGDGFQKPRKEVEIPKDIQPGTPATLLIPELAGNPWSSFQEWYLELTFTLRDSTNWAGAGHEIAFGQIQLTKAPGFRLLKDIETSSAPKINQVSNQLLEITGEKISWLFDLLHGSLVSMRKGGVEMLHSPPVLDFYRAVTDNDRPKFGESWFEARVHQTKQHFRSTAWSLGEGVNIAVTSRIAPPVLEWSVDTVTSYSFTNQKLSIRVSGIPRGNKLPSTFPRIGLTLALNDIENVSWFGRGPGESYRDKKLSQKFGNHSLPIDDLFVDYEYPQENGNRTDVRWVSFSAKNSGPSLKAHFGALQGASFTASHYTTKDLDECEHPYELRKRRKEETVVRLDWAHHGLGTGSCGPATLPEYELRSGVFDYEVLFE